MRYVIIGNSYAGVHAAESIRKIDRKGEITILSAESYRAYARPLISYFLAGRVSRRGIYYRDKDFYQKNSIDQRLGERVVNIDTGGKEVRLENDKTIEYDSLLISTGGRPSLQKVDGLNARNVFTFTTLDDAKKIREAAKSKRKAVILGGGLIGIKAAEGLNACGVDVTIAITSPRVLSLILDEESGGIVNRQIVRKGIKLITGESAKEVFAGRSGEVAGVIFNSGLKIDCGIVVMAKGVRPNIDFLTDSGIVTNRGIVVDRQMRTNVNSVYAAGDVAEAWDMLNMRNNVIAIAPLACEQGRTAGSNMAGEAVSYAGGMSMNSIEVSGLPVMAIGVSNKADDDMEIVTFKRESIYRKLVFKDDKLIGALLLGDVRCGGVLTHLIKSQTNISPVKNKLSASCLKTGEFALISNSSACALHADRSCMN